MNKTAPVHARALFFATSALAAIACVEQPRRLPASTATSTSETFAVSLSVATPAGLPKCTSALAGNVAHVASPTGLWSCVGSTWIPIPCTNVLGGAVAYASTTKTLLACVGGAWTQIATPAAGPAGPQGAMGTPGTPGANGAPGATGPRGATGLASLISVTDEPAGARCATGGVRVDAGIDDDDDGALQAAEIDTTAYVCNGVAGSGAAGSGAAGSGAAGSGAPLPPPVTPGDLSGADPIGCPIFPTDNPWNTEIAGAAVHPRNTEYVRSVGETGHVLVALGPQYGMPFVIVPATQPGVPISYGTLGEDYSDESDPGPFPLPLNAPIEGNGPGGDELSGDRHVIAVQRGTCHLFELYNTVRTPSGFQCSSSARWDLRSNTLRTDGWTSADGAGLPIFPGLLRYDEIAAGEIRHALRFTAPRVQRAYVSPARHLGRFADQSAPPYGTRFRLRADFDEAPYSAAARVFIRALKRYGMFLADAGMAWMISGTDDARWTHAFAAEAQSIPVAAFEAVYTGAATCGWTPPSGEACDAPPVTTPSCGTAADCAPGNACQNGVCTTACDSTHLCNEGCCSSGTCVAGFARTACGSSGGACHNCGGGSCCGDVCIGSGQACP